MNKTEETHYRLTLEEARERVVSKWIDPGDYRASPTVLCNNGSFRNKSTRNKGKVTCSKCAERLGARFRVHLTSGNHEYATFAEAKRQAQNIANAAGGDILITPVWPRSRRKPEGEADNGAI